MQPRATLTNTGGDEMHRKGPSEPRKRAISARSTKGDAKVNGAAVAPVTSPGVVAGGGLWARAMKDLGLPAEHGSPALLPALEQELARCTVAFGTAVAQATDDDAPIVDGIANVMGALLQIFLRSPSGELLPEHSPGPLTKEARKQIMADLRPFTNTARQRLNQLDQPDKARRLLAEADALLDRWQLVERRYCDGTITLAEKDAEIGLIVTSAIVAAQALGFRPNERLVDSSTQAGRKKIESVKEALAQVIHPENPRARPDGKRLAYALLKALGHNARQIFEFDRPDKKGRSKKHKGATAVSVGK